MEFTLHYRGPLKAATGRNKRKDHKHDLRRYFHKQLKELWKLPQLSEFRDSLIVPEPDALESRTPLRRVGQYHFAPLIGSYFHLVASLEIVMLRPRARRPDLRTGRGHRQPAKDPLRRPEGAQRRSSIARQRITLVRRITVFLPARRRQPGNERRHSDRSLARTRGARLRRGGVVASHSD